MKLLGRTSIILAAALLVVGVTWAFAQSSLATSFGDRRDRFDQQPNTAATTENSQQPFADRDGERPGPPDGFGREHAGGSWFFGVIEVGSNAVIIGVIIAAGTLGSRLVRRFQAATRTRRQPPTRASQP